MILHSKTLANYCESCLVVLLLFCSRWAIATTVAVIVTPTGVVLAADSKATPEDKGLASFTVNKLWIVQKRLVIADVGTSEINSGNVSMYSFESFISRVINQLPVNVSVSDFAAIIEAESGKALSFVDDTIKTGVFPNQNILDECRTLVQYLIVGYENGQPTVFIVHMDIDWNAEKLVGPVKTLYYPIPGERSGFGLFTIGQADAIKSLPNRKSYANKQCRQRVPKILEKVISLKNLTLTEAQTFSKLLVEIEEQVDPNDVGGEVTVATILPNGTVSRSGKPKITLSKAGRSKKKSN